MNYPGGKGGCFRRIIDLMPPHDTYIETHLGGGNVLERKRPAVRNIGVDVDRSVIAAWGERRRRLSFFLELYCGDAAAFLRSFDFTGRELVYCDPPYMIGTRVRRNIYRHEYTDAQHEELLSVLVTLPCSIVISGYDSPLYRAVLEQRHGWRCVLVPNTTRGGRRIERVWCNFPDVDHRHDCRYTGENFRERERIKRKRARWRARLAAMPAGERQFILEALLDIQSSSAAIASRAAPAGSGDARSRIDAAGGTDAAGDGIRSPSLAMGSA